MALTHKTAGVELTQTEFEAADSHEGRASMAQMPDGTAGYVLTAAGAGVSPAYASLGAGTADDIMATLGAVFGNVTSSGMPAAVATAFTQAKTQWGNRIMVSDGTTDNTDLTTVDALLTAGGKVALVGTTYNFSASPTLTYGLYVGQGPGDYTHADGLSPLCGTEIRLATGTGIILNAPSDLRDMRIEKITTSTATSVTFSGPRSCFTCLKNIYFKGQTGYYGTSLLVEANATATTDVTIATGHLGPIVIDGAEYGIRLYAHGTGAGDASIKGNIIEVVVSWPKYPILLESDNNKPVIGNFFWPCQLQSSAATLSGITCDAHSISPDPPCHENYFAGFFMDFGSYTKFTQTGGAHANDRTHMFPA